VRAVVLNSFTGLAGLELSEVADPTPGDGEQLVRVRAAALGPWDLAGARGAFSAMGGSSEFPQIQGWDFAGETSDGRRVLGGWCRSVLCGGWRARWAAGVGGSR
jgi:NADPH:quinone reductase-like Zn-dependent oxidoreductase